jgi:hypothetical protein
MVPLNPRVSHALEQYIALSHEVQASLRQHQANLMAAGWSKPEAWAFCQKVEARILGPAMDAARGVIRFEEGVEERVREEVEREMERRSREE